MKNGGMAADLVLDEQRRRASKPPRAVLPPRGQQSDGQHPCAGLPMSGAFGPTEGCTSPTASSHVAVARFAPGLGVLALNDPRLRSLRLSKFIGLFYKRDCFYRFWFQDLRRFALFLTLMRESKWLREDASGNFSLAMLAQQSQLSVARVSQILSDCTAAGDFTRHSDARDARYLVFEPSDAACAALTRMVTECCATASMLLDRDDPAPKLNPARMRQVCKAFIDHGLACLSNGDLNNRSLGSLTFYMAMADLALHSPIVTSDFIRREAVRLQVTTVTLRNVLRRAEQGGWVERAGRMLVMSPEAQASAKSGIAALIDYLAVVLATAEDALFQQELAAAGSMPRA